MKRPSVFKHGRRALILIIAVAIASLAFASTASASPPTPPFKQCPAYGFDTSCAVLVVVNAHGGFESYTDPSQGPFDGKEDVLIGVQNNSSSSVTSVTLKGNDLFGFDGDGLCSGLKESESEEYFAPSPAGCPFGRTGYEGPNTSFSNYKEEDAEQDADEGTVNFLNGSVEPGESSYFSLESRPVVNCAETACETTALSTELSGGSQSGTAITVSDETAVRDSATLSGTNAAIATGTIGYKVYSDPECKDLVAEAGEVTVTGGGAAAPSHPETLSPGTYYWQASYSGDSHNGSSQSACGSEVETVESAVTCSKLDGNAHIGTGSGRESTDNNVNTGLTGKQVFSFNWDGGAHKVHLWHLKSASCVVQNGEKTFSGQGEAKEKNVKGYEISFAISIGREGRVYLTVVIEKNKEVLEEVVHVEWFKGKELIS